MKRLMSILVGVVLIGAFVGTLVYLYSKSEEPPETFETTTAAVRDVVEKTVATGSVVPRNEVEIKPQVSGIVQELFVEPGDAVRDGDPIARIRIIPNMLSLSTAESRLDKAEIALEKAEIDLERSRELRTEGVVSDAEFRDVELAWKNAREEVAAARDSLEVIRRGSRADASATSNTIARATIDGMVLEVPLEQGDSVIETNTFNDGTTIATVADMGELVFEGTVDESEVGKLHPGMDLVLTIGAIADRTFDATLEHIAPKGIEEAGAIQFEIRAALAPHEGAFIRANYSANADIVLDRRDGVLAIEEALVRFEDDGDAWVEVESAPQRFERRDVELGLSDGIHVEVLAGLDRDDRIKLVR